MVGDCNNDVKTVVLGETAVLVRLLPPEIPHGLTWIRTRRPWCHAGDYRLIHGTHSHERVKEVEEEDNKENKTRFVFLEFSNCARGDCVGRHDRRLGPSPRRMADRFHACRSPTHRWIPAWYLQIPMDASRTGDAWPCGISHRLSVLTKHLMCLQSFTVPNS